MTKTYNRLIGNIHKTPKRFLASTGKTILQGCEKEAHLVKLPHTNKKIQGYWLFLTII